MENNGTDKERKRNFLTQTNEETLYLAKATKQDIADLYYWSFIEERQEAKEWNAPYIQEKKMSLDEYEVLWQKELAPGIPDGLVLRMDDRVIGYVGSYWLDRHSGWLETGIVIFDSQYWDGGYGSFAYEKWIDYIFEQTSIHRLGMSTWSGNTRMIRVAEKTGMVEEARVRQARLVDGEYYDAVKMGMLRSEWEALKE
ncbi:GNAT family N-acetyltransferase [Halobacillus litoralis]|nr:GNAT family N-acetyltransferase [Halobacillus litoralis]